MQHGRECGHEYNLIERCSDNNFGGHVQDIDHGGDHDKPATYTHDGRKDANKHTNHQRRKDRDIQTRRAKTRLDGHRVDPITTTDFLRWPLSALGASQRAQAFEKHQAADHTQKYDITQAHHQIDLAQRFEIVEQQHAQPCAKDTANHQNAAQFQINGFALKMRQNTRN